MSFCRNCGAKISDDTSFCPNCGARVSEGNASGESSSTNAVTTVRRYTVAERNIAVAIILDILTCGLYGIYWMVKLNDEMLEVSNEEGSGGLLVLALTILTCGIYGFFWYYKMGKCVDKTRGGVESSTGILYIVLAVLGLGIVNYALIQDAINDTVRKNG